MGSRARPRCDERGLLLLRSPSSFTSFIASTNGEISAKQVLIRVAIPVSLPPIKNSLFQPSSLPPHHSPPPLGLWGLIVLIVLVVCCSSLPLPLHFGPCSQYIQSRNKVIHSHGKVPRLAFDMSQHFIDRCQVVFVRPTE